MDLVKVEGAGNDFLVGLRDWAPRLAGNPELVRRLCRGRLGIGADGAVAVFAGGGADVRTVHLNADGSAADFCANATRCVARLAVERLGLDPSLVVTTGWAEIPARVSGDTVELDLPEPGAPPRPLVLSAAGRTWHGLLIHVGVPHLVVECENLESLDLGRFGPALRSHDALGPEGANVDFYSVNADGVGIRTWERGVEAETLCCGSGVVATALAVMAEHGLERLGCVPRSSAELEVWARGEPPTCPTTLRGPARLVADVEPCPELLEGLSL